jgi:hypothetical protein
MLSTLTPQTPAPRLKSIFLIRFVKIWEHLTLNSLFDNNALGQNLEDLIRVKERSVVLVAERKKVILLKVEEYLKIRFRNRERELRI